MTSSRSVASIGEWAALSLSMHIKPAAHRQGRTCASKWHTGSMSAAARARRGRPGRAPGRGAGGPPIDASSKQASVEAISRDVEFEQCPKSTLVRWLSTWAHARWTHTRAEGRRAATSRSWGRPRHACAEGLCARGLEPRGGSRCRGALQGGAEGSSREQGASAGCGPLEAATNAG